MNEGLDGCHPKRPTILEIMDAIYHRCPELRLWHARGEGQNQAGAVICLERELKFTGRECTRLDVQVRMLLLQPWYQEDRRAPG
jgi:hypothetical protein